MTTSMAEPEWDEDTRNAALALGLYEDSLCPKCGRPTWVCQTEEFVPDLPIRCNVATAQIIASANADEDYQQAGALFFPVKPRGPMTEEADGG